MLTFALGAYALLGDLRIAVGAAVAAAGLLAFREELHGWVEKITWPELQSGLVLLAMTFLGLPILPDNAIGPFGGVNPREVWIIAIVLAGVSFLGYAAVKYFGARRGLLLAAAAGALASSTAVTVANARHAAAGEGSPRLLAAGSRGRVGDHVPPRGRHCGSAQAWSPHADRAHPPGYHTGGIRVRHQLGVLAKDRHS
jgi:uncharacterized membrane protein (DUF4010 family)